MQVTSQGLYYSIRISFLEQQKLSGFCCFPDLYMEDNIFPLKLSRLSISGLDSSSVKP